MNSASKNLDEELVAIGIIKKREVPEYTGIIHKDTKRQKQIMIR
jgi:hypothetical protein